MVDHAELLERARAGSSAALAELFHRHAAEVHRVAWHLLRSAADADDVVQEVFVGLPLALRGFRAEGRFEAWLRAIAARTALMRLRSARRRPDTAPLTHDRAGRGGADALIDRLALERALSALPEPLRVVFVLKVVEGFDHEEIAGLLGITELASRTRLSRARRELRKLLA